MSSILRINSITSRSGINTLDFTGNGFSYVTDVGFGTTNPRGKLDVQGTFLANGGNAGIGTTLPTSRLDVVGDVQVSGVVTATSFRGDGSSLTGVAATSNIRTNAIDNSGITTVSAGSASIPSISPSGDPNTGIFFPSADTIAFAEGGVEAVRIDSSGRLGIGTTSASVRLHVNVDSSSETDIARFQASNGSDIQFLDIGVDATNNLVSYDSTGSAGGAHVFRRGGSEVMRLDDSSRVLVGLTTSASTDNNANFPKIQLEGIDGDASRLLIRSNGGTTSTSGPILYLARSRGTTSNSKTAVVDGDFLGSIIFEGTDGATDRRAAAITAFVDNGVSTNDMPGRLVFSTSPDGTSDPTEKLRITSSGNIGIGITNPSEKLVVAGKVVPSADNTHDLGSSSLRWANIFSADLQLSNEGSQNDVDGTWGNYTIQEGENDLFLINRRNGKKYKFVLQEVN
jgi:hypothetical protein